MLNTRRFKFQNDGNAKKIIGNNSQNHPSYPKALILAPEAPVRRDRSKVVVGSAKAKITLAHEPNLSACVYV